MDGWHGMVYHYADITHNSPILIYHFPKTNNNHHKNKRNLSRTLLHSNIAHFTALRRTTFIYPIESKRPWPVNPVIHLDHISRSLLKWRRVAAAWFQIHFIAHSITDSHFGHLILRVPPLVSIYSSFKWNYHSSRTRASRIRTTTLTHMSNRVQEWHHHSVCKGQSSDNVLFLLLFSSCRAHSLVFFAFRFYSLLHLPLHRLPMPSCRPKETTTRLSTRIGRYTEREQPKRRRRRTRLIFFDYLSNTFVGRSSFICIENNSHALI